MEREEINAETIGGIVVFLLILSINIYSFYRAFSQEDIYVNLMWGQRAILFNLSVAVIMLVVTTIVLLGRMK